MATQSMSYSIDCIFENFPLLSELWTFENIFDLILVHPLYVDWDW